MLYMAPNETAYTRWSCHSGLANPVHIGPNLPAPRNRAPITVFRASRPCGPAGWLAMLLINAGDVETNPRPTTTHKQAWICDICHRQQQVMKQISIRCNRIEHWVHPRCSGIRQAQCTDTWTCHQHIIQTHNTHRYNTTPPSQTLAQVAHPLSSNTTHTTATKTQTHIPLSPYTSRIGYAQTQSCHPLTSNTSHPAPSKTHTHVTHSTYTTRSGLVTCRRM